MERSSHAGENTGFLLDEKEYAVEFLPAFYDWLYCRALSQNQEHAKELENFVAYCSIKSSVEAIKCEARATAIYEGLRMSGLIQENQPILS